MAWSIKVKYREKVLYSFCNSSSFVPSLTSRIPFTTFTCIFFCNASSCAFVWTSYSIPVFHSFQSYCVRAYAFYPSFLWCHTSLVHVRSRSSLSIFFLVSNFSFPFHLIFNGRKFSFLNLFITHIVMSLHPHRCVACHILNKDLRLIILISSKKKGQQSIIFSVIKPSDWLGRRKNENLLFLVSRFSSNNLGHFVAKLNRIKKERNRLLFITI